MPERNLPIWEIHSELVEVLTRGNRLVLVAPTGSGKTTQVPQMILDAGLAGEAGLTGKKIVVLQPRRVAARTVAARVAWERRCKLGEEVGYQVRFDDQTGLGTRICFVTEGILLRWLQDNPNLDGIAAVLFDEFHERNLLSDVALALVRQLQNTTRPDLKMAVMSATLEARPVAAYLGGCPVLISEGQSWPVETVFQDHHDERPIFDQAADMVEKIVQSGAPGDILVFMPGMAEINATLRAVGSLRMDEPLALIALHGDLPPDEQDMAFIPHPRRKVVVATNVAETSVTIDGIRHVVDSGLARVARYDADRGINTLNIEPISRASADQRRGRAGRTAPGVCHRLWTESGQLNRPERNTPEIQRSDLAEVVLLLHSLGVRQASHFEWLDRPDPQAVERAEALLLTLGALQPVADAAVELRTPPSTITPMGRRMMRLPMHPRYSRMLLEAARHQCVPAAALCAALVSGRDMMMRLGRDDKHIAEARELFEGSALSDFFTLMRAWQFAKNRGFQVDACRRYGIHAQTAAQVDQTYEQLMRIAGQEGLVEKNSSKEDSGEGESAAPVQEKAGASKSVVPDDPLLKCILAGFADQLCRRLDTGSLDCELTEGRTGTLMRESVVQDAPLFVAAVIREVSGRGSAPLTLLGLATAVKREWIEEMFSGLLASRIEHLYDRTHRRVAAVKLVRFKDMVIHFEHQREGEAAAAGRCLAEAYSKGLFELPLLNHAVKQWVARVKLACFAMPDMEFPAFDGAAMTECLARAFKGVFTVKEAQGIHLDEYFKQHLAKEQQAWLDELLPLAIPWDGRQVKLLYVENNEDDEPGVELQVKLHECFGLKAHPHLAEGNVAVKLWLCAPDGKRIESTYDWPAFRGLQYPKLRRTLQQKYPGVAWV